MLKGQVYWEILFTIYGDDGKSRLITETMRMDDGYKAVDTAYDIIKMERWVNVQVIEHGREYGPEIQFDWRFYNQPAWAKHILKMDQDNEEN